MSRRDSFSLLFLGADKFPPFRSDVSVLFGQEILGRGHKVEWILQSSDSCDKSYQTELNGSRVWVGKTDNGSAFTSRLKKHLYSIIHDFSVFQKTRESEYDFVQVKDKFVSALFSIVAARLYGVKFLYWLSYPFPEASIYKYHEGTARYPLLYLIRGLVLKHLLYRVILPMAEHVFVQSDQMKKDVMLQGIDAEKLTAVPMGVALERIPNIDISSTSPIDDDVPSIVYLGTLTSVRRMDFLVRVLPYVLEEIPNAILYLVGDSEDEAGRKLIDDEADRLGVTQSLRITGFLPQSEAFKYVRDASVCVSPFFPTPILDSTSPTKLVEYMAMSRPVVANDHPDQQTVINESAGGICVPYDEKVFAGAILELLNDPVRSEEMGKKGRQYVEQHRSYEKIADRVIEQYLSLV